VRLTYTHRSVAELGLERLGDQTAAAVLLAARRGANGVAARSWSPRCSAARAGSDWAAQTDGLLYDIDPVPELELEFDPEPEPMLGQFASECACGVVLGVVGVVVVATGMFPVVAEPPPTAASAPPPPAARAPPTASTAMRLRGEMGYLLSRSKKRNKPT
jgi:hypothetical protein